jgi:hypothetical protein
MPRLEPPLELETGRVRRIGAREAALGEAQLGRFGPYCFLKALALMHAAQLHRSD